VTTQKTRRPVSPEARQFAEELHHDAGVPLPEWWDESYEHDPVKADEE